MSLYHLQLDLSARLHAPNTSNVRPTLAGTMAISSLPGNNNGRGRRSLNARYDQLLGQIKIKGKSILSPKIRSAKPTLKKLPSRPRGGLFSHSVSALPVSAPSRRAEPALQQPARHHERLATTSAPAREQEASSFLAVNSHQRTLRRDGFQPDATSTPRDVEMDSCYPMDEGRGYASLDRTRGPSSPKYPNYAYQFTPTPGRFHLPTQKPQQGHQPMSLAQHRVRFRPAHDNKLYSPLPDTYLRWQVLTPMKKGTGNPFVSRSRSMVSSLAGVGEEYEEYSDQQVESGAFSWAPAPRQMDIPKVMDAPTLWQQPFTPDMEVGQPYQPPDHLSSSSLFPINLNAQTANIFAGTHAQYSPTPQSILYPSTNLGPMRHPRAAPASTTPPESIPPQLVQAHQSLLPSHIKSSSEKAKKARKERSYKVKGREAVRLLEDMTESRSESEGKGEEGPLVPSIAIQSEPSPSRTLVNALHNQHSSSATKVPSPGTLEGSSFDLSSYHPRPSPAAELERKSYPTNNPLKRRETPSAASSPVQRAGKMMKQMSVREKILGRVPTPGPTPLFASQENGEDKELDLDLDASESGVSQLAHSAAESKAKQSADIPSSKPLVLTLSQLPVLPLLRPPPDYAPPRKHLQPRRKRAQKRMQRVEFESATSEEAESIRSFSEPPRAGEVVDASDDESDMNEKKSHKHQGGEAVRVERCMGREKGWVDEGFFGQADGELGFRIWHD
ncbi:hypothetical protein IAR50_005232 [Cryptococcus sp. DSM 104548]